MKYIAVLALVVSVGISGQALASAKLVEDKQCLQCHAIDKETIGPSFKKIHTLWKGVKGAEAKLVATIRKGSDNSGGPHWGAAKMPDNSERPLVSEAEAKSIVKWIMKQ